jgi:Rrf2 family protein
MGPKGGYTLTRDPDRVSMLEVIQVMQDRVLVNRCTDGEQVCPHQLNCPVNGRLCTLQKKMDQFLKDVSIQDLVNDRKS